MGPLFRKVRVLFLEVGTLFMRARSLFCFYVNAGMDFHNRGDGF